MGGGPGKKGKALHETLPEKTPQEIKDFVACTKDKVELKGGKSPIPIPILGADVHPDIAFTGNADGSVGITMSTAGGYVKVNLKGKVNDAGELEVDTSELPAGKDAVDKWVKKFNDAVKKNKKKLGPPKVQNGNLVLEKVAVVAGGPGAGMGTGKKVAAAALAATAAAGIGLLVTTGGSNDPKPKEPAAVADGDGDPGTADTGEAVCGSPDDRPLLIMAQDTLPESVLREITGPEFTQYLECEGGTNNYTPFDPGGILALTPAQIDITHQGGVKDAETGQEGASYFSVLADTNFEPTIDLQASANCAGTVVTGIGSPAPDGSINIRVPLFQFGQCNDLRMSVIKEDGGTLPLPEQVLFPFGGFTVGPNEGPTAPYDTPFPFAAGAFDGDKPPEVYGSAYILAKFFTGQDPIGFHTTADSLPGLEGAPVLWQPSAAAPFDPTGAGDPRIHGATSFHVNGLSNPARDMLFGTVFPCGPGPLGFTVCPEGASTVPPSRDFFVAETLLSGNLTFDEGLPVHITLDLDVEGSGDPRRSYTIEGEGTEWTIMGGAGKATAAHAVIRNNTVLFAVPSVEIGSPVEGFAFDSEIGSTTSAIPSSPGFFPSGPAVQAGHRLDEVDSGDASAEPDEPKPEDAENFLRLLSEGVSDRTVRFLLRHLHPVVIETYGRTPCRDHLRNFTNDPLSGRTVTGSRSDPWDYVVDGRTTTIDNAVAVTAEGPDGSREFHFAFQGDRWRWFTDCGTPR